MVTVMGDVLAITLPLLVWGGLLAARLRAEKRLQARIRCREEGWARARVANEEAMRIRRWHEQCAWWATR